MIQNLRDLPRSLAFSAILSALVAVLVGYTGPILIVVQAAENAGLSQAQLSSWIWGITIGSGVSAIIMSLWYRQPMLSAWPTAGSALLVTSLAQYRYEEAIGAYILAAAAMVILGLSGWFGRVIDRVPRAVIAGMLAGVLLRFGINIFTSLGQAPLLIGVMILTYLLLRRLGYRAPSIGTLVVGLIVAGLSGQLSMPEFSLQLTTPVLTVPEFTLRGFLGLAVPLFILANVSQNAPGLAVLRSFGYRTPANVPLTITCIVSLWIAPFAGSGVALAAITPLPTPRPGARAPRFRRLPCVRSQRKSTHPPGQRPPTTRGRRARSNRRSTSTNPAPTNNCSTVPACSGDSSIRSQPPGESRSPAPATNRRITSSPSSPANRAISGSCASSGGNDFASLRAT